MIINEVRKKLTKLFLMALCNFMVIIIVIIAIDT